VFFFASQASMWAQPSDCGLNKRVHWATEQAEENMRLLNDDEKKLLRTDLASAIFMLLKFKLQESWGSGGEMSRRGLARETKFLNIQSCTYLEPLPLRIAKSL
jgi:hypothetical protein